MKANQKRETLEIEEEKSKELKILQELIREKTEEIYPDIQKLRREFHMFAEEGWLEMRTASRVAGILQNLGYEIRLGDHVCKTESMMGLPSLARRREHAVWAAENGADPDFLPIMEEGKTGIAAILRCKDAKETGPVVALRFDLDALPVRETKEEDHLPNREGFACRCYEEEGKDSGSMHACGHDGHTAIGIGCAMVFAALRDYLCGEIRLIFQPAEEGVRGARAMVDAGVLEGVEYLLGGHVMASEDGSAYVTPGLAGTLATTKLDVCFQGKAAHAAKHPELGRNALLAAATAVLNLQAISRHSEGASRINVGTLIAGPGRNVICDQAKMELEVRGESTSINAFMEEEARRIILGAAMMQDCQVEIQRMGFAPVLENSSELVERLQQFCREELKLLAIPVREPASLGASEDFATMTNWCIAKGGQAVFTGIHVPTTAPLHNEAFDFAEEALLLGMRYFTGVTCCLMLEEKGR